jgi:hypothetical protein
LYLLLQGEIERTDEMLPGFEDLEKETAGRKGGGKRKAEEDAAPGAEAAALKVLAYVWWPGLLVWLAGPMLRAVADRCCRSPRSGSRGRGRQQPMAPTNQPRRGRKWCLRWLAVPGLPPQLRLLQVPNRR